MMPKINYIVYNWYEYVRANRIVGIFLIAIAFSVCLFLLAYRYPNKSDQFKLSNQELQDIIGSKRSTTLLIYSALFSLLLLLPPVALIFMQFQTVFYPYSSLWLLVPIIPVTAFLLTKLFFHIASRQKKSTSIVSVVLILAVLFTCGSMGSSLWRNKEFHLLKHDVSYKQAQPLMEVLEKYANSNEYGQDFTILAPINITAYAHMYSGKIHTLYGKDMWDDNMRPLTYNIYSEDVQKLYSWINCIEVYGALYCLDDQSPKFSVDLDYYFDDFEKAIKADEALGGIVYTELAKQEGIDVIVMYNTGEYVDKTEFEYIVEHLDLRYEYVDINDTEGYILLFL